MSAQKIECPVCAYQYDVSAASACGECPLMGGCELVCCPNCGNTTVDINRSGLVRLANRIVAVFKGGGTAVQNRGAGEDLIRLERIPLPVPVTDAEEPAPAADRAPRRLSEVAAGQRVRVMSLGEGLTPPRCARLQAYGVVPGYWVTVIQHDPVTVIRVDHLELAMEGEMAEGILVQE